MNGRTDRRTDGQTDRQTDRQGQILMPPDYRHGGIKKKYCENVVFVRHSAAAPTSHNHMLKSEV